MLQVDRNLVDPFVVCQSLDPIDWDTVYQWFKSLSSSAFRFELLQEFDVGHENEAIEIFRSGVKTPPLSMYEGEWLDGIRTMVKEGKSVQRARYVVEPLTEYTAWELWAYATNVDAGEEIRVLSDLGALSSLPSVPIFKDYWLFDDEIVVLMEYDLRGTFLGCSRVKEQYVAPYVALKNEALDKSMLLQQSKFWQGGQDDKDSNQSDSDKAA